MRVELIATIESELKEARLARDDERRDALALILASLRAAEKELQRPLSEDEELQVLQRERKKRVEAFQAFEAAGREEQADKEDYELEVLEEFMPDPLSEDELDEIVDDVIAEVGATSLRDIGRVMADVMPRVSGKADGSAVSQIVREKLAYLGGGAGLDRSRLARGGGLVGRGATRGARARAYRPDRAAAREAVGDGSPHSDGRRGDVWFKANMPGLEHEARLVALLAERRPDCIPPLAHDPRAAGC